MQAEAIKKLRDEMATNRGDEFVVYIGEFLTKHLESNPSVAEKILAEGKSLVKCMDFMEAKAREKAKGSNKRRVGFTPEQGCMIVLQYFGIDGAPVVPPTPVATPATATVAPAPAPVQPTTKASTDFNVSLDDLL